MAGPATIRIFRAIAVAAAATGFAFMALFMWEMHQATPSVFMWAVLFVRLLAVVAAARPWPLLMFVLVTVAFIPMGRYFLGSPLYRIAVIGASDLVYFACTVALFVLASRTTQSAASEDCPHE